MDHYKLSAPAIDKRGHAGTFSVRVSQRDSETTSRDEWALVLARAADRARVTLTGPLVVEQTGGIGQAGAEGGV